MKFNFKNVGSEFAKLKQEQAKLLEKEESKVINNLKKELEDATPIDTGLARSSWELSGSSGEKRLTNTVDYIESLNNGHSKQAPSNFVQHIAIKFGKPLGPIITVT